jgi:hypothetical protein
LELGPRICNDEERVCTRLQNRQGLENRERVESDGIYLIIGGRWGERIGGVGSIEGDCSIGRFPSPDPDIVVNKSERDQSVFKISSSWENLNSLSISRVTKELDSVYFFVSAAFPSNGEFKDFLDNIQFRKKEPPHMIE